jgi:hypothetical protein
MFPVRTDTTAAGSATSVANTSRAPGRTPRTWVNGGLISVSATAKARSANASRSAVSGI